MKLLQRFAFWRKRPPVEAPLTNEWCQTCFRQLREGEVFELRQHMTNTIEMTRDALQGGGGGSFMACCYCEEHAPEGAIKL